MDELGHFVEITSSHHKGGYSLVDELDRFVEITSSSLMVDLGHFVRIMSRH